MSFRTARSLLEWHFSTQRLQSPQAGGSGGTSDAHSLDAKALRRAKVVMCWAAVTDKTQQGVLGLACRDGLSTTQIANRTGADVRTVERILGRGFGRVRDKAVELRLMDAP